jgi:hypothetical protein
MVGGGRQGDAERLGRWRSWIRWRKRGTWMWEDLSTEKSWGGSSPRAGVLRAKRSSPPAPMTPIELAGQAEPGGPDYEAEW